MDLEETVRAVLAERAEDADVSASVAHRARAAVRRRRTRTTLAAAVVVAVVVAVSAVVATRHSHDSAVPAGPATQTPYDAGPGFRLEVWHDLAVSVPATWGWGTSPTATTPCASGAMVGADGHRLARPDPTMPYVGRPIAAALDCHSGPTTAGHVPFVWLGMDLPSGAVDTGDGWVQQTRAVAGTTVTVYTDNAALRRTVLSSAHRWTGPCAPRLDSPPSVSRLGGFVKPVSMTVCAYAADQTATRDVTGYDLLYEARVAMGPAKDLVAAVANAPETGEYSCYGGQGGEWVLLRVNGDGSSHRDYVVDPQCPSIADPDGVQHTLTYADVAPWAMTGVNAVIHDNPLIKLGFFIPQR